MIRFGVMCGALPLRQADYLVVEHLLRIEGVSLELIITYKSGAKRPLLRRLIHRALSSTALWAAYLVLHPHDQEGRRDTDHSAVFADVPRLAVQTYRLTRAKVESLGDADLETIRGYDLDFILRLDAFGVLVGGILSAAKHGIWSFHHGDEMRYRGTPAAFWEIFTGDPVTGGILQRLTPRLDGGVVLRKWFVATDKCSYRANWKSIVMAGVGMPAQVCLDLKRGVAPYLNSPPSNSTAPVRRSPTNRQMVIFAWRISKNRLRRKLSNLCTRECWRVGIIPAPIERLFAAEPLPPVQWLRYPGPTGFLADPIGLDYRDGVVKLLAEEYSYQAERGSIVMLTVRDGVVGASTPVVGGEHHVSFPFVLRHGENTLCVPESIRNGEGLWSYKHASATGSWVKHRVIGVGVRAIDPCIYHFQDKWWLFCTVPGPLAMAGLHIWYASDLFGEWRPHTQNPVKIDVRSARPAGPLFTVADQLYRPAQDCSLAYGNAIAINRITHLGPDEFHEEVVRVIRPFDGTSVDGVHTLSALGPITLIDGKRMELSPATTVRRVFRKLTKIASNGNDR